LVHGLGLVLDRDGLWFLIFLVRVPQGHSKLELLLRLGRTVELLPNGDVTVVENDVGRGRIGVPFEGGMGSRSNG
jgi:hypothetical protein